MASAAARRICVTGATGTAGRAVVRDLREHGFDVAPTDIAVTRDDREAGTLQADLTDYGQAVEVLRGADAVVHLANIPAPGLSTPAVTFNDNILCSAVFAFTNRGDISGTALVRGGAGQNFPTVFDGVVTGGTFAFRNVHGDAHAVLANQTDTNWTFNLVTS